MSSLSGRWNQAFRAYLEWVSRHPWAIFLASIAFTALIGSGLSRLEIYVDLDANLPAGHPYVEADREIRALFGGRSQMAVGVRPREGTIWTPRYLRLVSELTEDGLGLPHVIEANVFSIASSKAKDIRGTEDGFEALTLLDPLPETAEEAERVREAWSRNRRSLGPTVSEDGRMALVALDFEEGVSDDTVYRICRDFVDGFAARYPDVELVLTGTSSFNHFFSENARRTQSYFLLALVVIMATLFASFRSIQGTLLPISTGILATLWGLGLMGYSGTHMDGWNSMTPILILAVAAGHSVQILKRYYEEYARLAGVTPAAERSRLAVVEATHRIGLVMIVAGSVAAGSFASLAVFGIPSIRTFGIFTALGIVSAVLLEMTFVPAFRVILKPPGRVREKHESRVDRALAALGRSLTRPGGRHVVYGVGLALLAASAFLATRIETNNTVRLYLGDRNEARLAWQEIDRHLGGMVSFLVLLESERDDAMQDPAVLQWMAGLSDELLRLPTVGYSVSMADLVRRLHLAMHADDEAYDAIPDNARLVAQYLFLYGLTADVEDFSRFQTSDGRKGLVRSGLRSDEDRDVETTIRATEAYLAAHPLPEGVTMQISGMGAIGHAMNHTLTEAKILNMGQILLMIYAISSLILGSVVAGLFVLLPLVLAGAATFALLGAFGIWLNMGTATVTAMGIGIGADYAIYVLYRFREEYRRLGDAREAAAVTMATSGKAVLLVAAAISSGYAALGASDFYVNEILSRLVPMTMGMSALAALTLMPAALLHSRPRFLFGVAETEVERDRPVEPAA